MGVTRPVPRMLAGAAGLVGATLGLSLLGSGVAAGEPAGSQAGNLVWTEGNAAGIDPGVFGVFGGAASAGGRDVVVVGLQGQSAAGVTWSRTGDGAWTTACGLAPAPACPQGVRVGPGVGAGPAGVILFGGLDGPFGVSQTLLGDTWRFDGGAGNWVQVCTTANCGPGARVLPAVAGNGTEVLMYGGMTGGPNSDLDDTWRFDGNTWTKLCGSGMAACGPGPRAAASMTWDGTQFVLFGGGFSGGNQPGADTWVWGGSNWTKVCGPGMSECGPGPRTGASFARLDGGGGAGALLASGIDFSGSEPLVLRDVWFWDGSAWAAMSLPWDPAPVQFNSPVCGPFYPYLLPHGATLAMVTLWMGPSPRPRVLNAGFGPSGEALSPPCAEIAASTTTAAPTTTTTTVAPTTTTTAAAAATTTTTTAAPTTTTADPTTTTTAASGGVRARLPATGPPEPSPRNLAPAGLFFLLTGLGALLAAAASPARTRR